MKLLKNWQVLIFILGVVLSLILISPSTERVVIVQSVSPDSPLAGKLAPGERLEWINEQKIQSARDLIPFEQFTGTLRFMHNGKLDLANIEKPGLGISVTEKPYSNIKFGLDIVGGSRVLLKPKENVTPGVVEQSIATLQTRINVYGLREAKFQHVRDVISGQNYIQIEMAGGTKQEIDYLLARQGKFEAKIPKVVYFENGRAQLLGQELKLLENKIRINNKDYSVNQSFKLNGIDWAVLNISNKSATLLATVFRGSDIKSVCITEQAGICVSRIQRTAGGYRFIFQITVSDEGAQRFADVTRGMKAIVDPRTGESYLESKIYFYIDEKQITELTIASDLAGRTLTQPSITGFRKTRKEAVQEKLALQSILQSGALPVSFEIVRVDQISPSLGIGFLKSALIAGVIAAAAVGTVIFIRYRKLKLSVPVILTAVSEVIMVLGVAVAINWTIDLAALAAIIATVGTGVDAQIMILDELIMGREQKIYTLKQRIKRAFFIIFGAAATIIAAMLPLGIIGVGIMRGFAIVTSIGVLIGVFITRPAFSKIAEALLEKEHYD